MPWTIELAGVTKSLADWGLTDAQLSFRSQASDIFSAVHDGASFDTAPIFAYRDEIILRDPENVIRFRGRRIVTDAHADRTEALIYQFAGPWDYFEKHTFHQSWKNGGEGYSITSHIRVPSRFNGSLIEVINAGEQIAEVVDFINGLAAAPVMTLGIIAPEFELPIQERVDQKCSEVIREMLTLAPDAICYFDYSTQVPTFHVLQRSGLTAKTIALSEERLTQIRLRRRDDMVPGSVVINYERVDTVDGLSSIAYGKDAAPESSVGTEYNALCQTVKLYGAERVTLRGRAASQAIPVAPDLQWFIDRGLLQGETGTITDFEFTGRDGELPFEIVPGGPIQSWMLAGTALAEMDTFRCVFTYTVEGENGRKIERTKPGQVQINTTNVPDGNYEEVASAVAGESAPEGLAQSVFDSLSTVPFEGSIVLTEEEAEGDISLFHMLNISGGTGRFAAMNALVQAVSIVIDSGQTTVQLGPPVHLGIADIIEMLRFNRTRRVYTNSAVQQSAQLAGTEITLEGDTAIQNATTAPGVPIMHQWGASGGEFIRVDPTGAAAVGESGPNPTGSLYGMVRDPGGTLRAVTFREVIEITKDGSGNCVEKKRLYICSEQYG